MVATDEMGTSEPSIQQFQSNSDSATDVGEDASTCACSGTKNAKGLGGKCGHEGYYEPWCYVSAQCQQGLISREVAGAKWIAGCTGAERTKGTKALGETIKKLSTYNEEKLELGEDALEQRGTGGTRPGWSWGITIASNSQYPKCIDECKANPDCVGATYNPYDVPPSNPAGAPVTANTCHQFHGITQKNTDDRQYQTWLSPQPQQ